MRFILVSLSACGVAALSACGTSSKGGASLTAADFAAAGSASPAVVSGGAEPPAAAKPVRPVGPGDVRGPIDASDGILDVTAVAGSPASVRASAPPAASRVDVAAGSSAAANPAPGATGAGGQPDAGPVAGTLVDAKVGDINGKPIYANVFLAPMSDRLRAEAKLMRYAEWKQAASKRITEELAQMIEKELLRAEALASFTPEQKQGFFAWMESVQDKMKSQYQGSREMASRQIEETEGKSLDEYLKERQQNELASFQISEKIARRISVSKRDVEVEYQRMYEYFNPPPRAQFRLVQIAKDSPADIAEFKRLLDSGTPFADLAVMPLNRYKAETGGLEERELKGERKDAKLFANETLNKAAQTIEPGQTVGPIELSASFAWLHLEQIETKSMSLYDAQIRLENMLREQRVRAAKDKYISELKKRASMTSTEEMAARLLVIAEARFYPDKNYQPPVKAKK